MTDSKYQPLLMNCKMVRIDDSHSFYLSTINHSNKTRYFRKHYCNRNGCQTLKIYPLGENNGYLLKDRTKP